MSLSWVHPHTGQVQCLTLRSLTSLFWYPQFPQVWLLGKKVGTFTTTLPAHADLYSSCRKNSLQAASEILFARWWFRNIPFTLRSSTQMIWFSFTSVVDNL